MIKLARTMLGIADIPIDYRAKDDKFITDFLYSIAIKDKFEHELLIISLFRLLEVAQLSYEDLHGEPYKKR